MKRVRSDEELQEAADAMLKDFPFEKLMQYRDVMYTLITRSGLTVPEMQRLCSINKRWRTVCEDKRLWEKLFIEKVLAKKKLPDTEAAREPYYAMHEYAAWTRYKGMIPNDLVRLITLVYANSTRLELWKVQNNVYETVVLIDEGDEEYVAARVTNMKSIPRSIEFKIIGRSGLLHWAVRRHERVLVICTLLENGWHPLDNKRQELLKCFICFAPAQGECGNSCGTLYCSDACADEHWYNHKHECSK